MRLDELAERIGARIFQDRKTNDREIRHVYGGDKISDLLNAASGDTLIVTNLDNSQLFRIAEIMDVQGICLLNNVTVREELLESAAKHGTTVLISPGGMFETCGKIYECLRGKGPSKE